MSADEFPQSVVEAARSAVIRERGVHEPIPREDQIRTALTAALAEYERLGRYLISLDGKGLERVARAAGLCLVRDDEATVERMRPFPMQDGPPIPWCVAEAIYEHLYREKGQSLERLAERGGFAWREVDFMWRDRQWRTTDAQREACGQQVLSALTAAQGGEAA